MMSDPEESADVHAAERFARVVRAIEGEIIPRFLMSFVAPLQSAHGREAAVLRPHAEAPALARLLLSTDACLAGALVHAVRGEHLPPDRICLELLAPAGRELGELWEKNECDFDEYATGMERLLNMLQFVTEAASEECPTPGG